MLLLCIVCMKGSQWVYAAFAASSGSPPVVAAARMQERKQNLPTAQLAHAQAPLLAHTLLHHPQAWPRQDIALGLLVSLRKFYQINWVRHRMLSPVRLSP